MRAASAQNPGGMKLACEAFREPEMLTSKAGFCARHIISMQHWICCQTETGKRTTSKSAKTDILYSRTLFSPNTHLGVLVRVVDVTHDDSQALDHSLPDHVSLILSQHLLQHGQDQGAPDLLLQRQQARWMKRINFSAFYSQSFAQK